MGVLGYLPENDQNSQVFTRIPESMCLASRVFSPGVLVYVPEYYQNDQVWYPGTPENRNIASKRPYRVKRPYRIKRPGALF